MHLSGGPPLWLVFVSWCPGSFRSPPTALFWGRSASSGLFSGPCQTPSAFGALTATTLFTCLSLRLELPVRFQSLLWFGLTTLRVVCGSFRASLALFCPLAVSVAAPFHRTVSGAPSFGTVLGAAEYREYRVVPYGTIYGTVSGVK